MLGAVTLLLAATAGGAAPYSAPASEISLLDLVELDLSYTTVSDNYYRAIGSQALLDGARTGLVAEARRHGILDPAVPLLHVRSDGRGAVPAMERLIGTILLRYPGRFAPRDLVYAAVRGELAVLHDPYSVFFTKSELTSFSTVLDGRSFGGIGVVLVSESGDAVAQTVFDGGPAARAGVLPGDRIVSIDGIAAAGLRLADVERHLRGSAGTTVRLVIARAAVGDLALAIVRAAVTPPDVSARLLPGRIGYLALRGFGPDAGAQVNGALADLRRQGARATIFDLRGNGGGYESSAVRVASAFIAGGPIVSIQANHGGRRVTTAVDAPPPPLPLVVLVDGDSASGSELVTGAIQDRGAGRVVGTRTFGKGLVQTIFPLPDGSAVKLTTARYFTPNGRDIDRVGITPDVTVAEPRDAVRGEAGHDPQLDAALALLAG